MDQAVHVPIALLDLVVSSFQGGAIGGIGRDIERFVTQSGQRRQFALDGSVLGPSADPDEARLVGFDHETAPALADTASAANDHIDPVAPVALVLGGEM